MDMPYSPDSLFAGMTWQRMRERRSARITGMIKALGKQSLSRTRRSGWCRCVERSAELGVEIALAQDASILWLSHEFWHRILGKLILDIILFECYDLRLPSV
jgi:hypothetical protein